MTPLTTETVMEHSAELRHLAAMDHASWDYVQAAMRSAADEIDRLRRGEFICSRCYLRKPADGEVECEF